MLFTDLVKNQFISSMHRLKAKDIKEFIVRHKNCTIGSTISLKRGADLYIDLLSLGAKNIHVYFKKQSGDGSIFILKNKVFVRGVVNSIISYKTSVDGGILHIRRANNAMGSVDLHELLINESYEGLYSNILEKITSTGVVISGSKLMARKNAFIADINIVDIDCNPNNYVKTKDGYKFSIDTVIDFIDIDDSIKRHELKSDFKSKPIDRFPLGLKADSPRPVITRSNSVDLVERDSRYFSDLLSESYKPDRVLDIKGTITPVSYSAKTWLNKVYKFCPKVTRGDGLVMGEFGDLRPGKKIWIDESQYFEISEKDNEVLSKCDKIFSSSLPNVQLLKRHYDNVEYIPKIWPWVEPKKFIDKKDYILYFNRSKRITNELLKLNIDNLVIVNARGSYPDGVTAIGSNIPYDNLVHLIVNSRAIIDLPECNHYMSGLLDFCLIAGVPMITSNHWMSIVKPKQFFIESEYDGYLKPKFSQVIKAISDIDSYKRKDKLEMSTYNLNLKHLMMTLFED